MNVRLNKKSIVFTDIMNSSLLDSIQGCVAIAKCNVEMSDFSTKAKVTGTQAQLSSFINAYNGE